MDYGTPSRTSGGDVQVGLLRGKSARYQIGLTFRPIPTTFPLSMKCRFNFRPFPRIPCLFVKCVVGTFPCFLVKLIIRRVLVRVILGRLFPLHHAPDKGICTVHRVTRVILFQRVTFPREHRRLL